MVHTNGCITNEQKYPCIFDMNEYIGILNYVKKVPNTIVEIFTEKIKDYFNYIIKDASTKNILNMNIKKWI